MTLEKREFSTWRAAIEYLADHVEETARVFTDEMPDEDRKNLFALAWNLKQVARRRTMSEGI